VLCISPPPPQELDESKQEVERLQTELQSTKENFSKAQNTIRAARKRIQDITSEREQVRLLKGEYQADSGVH